MEEEEEETASCSCGGGSLLVVDAIMISCTMRGTVLHPATTTLKRHNPNPTWAMDILRVFPRWERSLLLLLLLLVVVIMVVLVLVRPRRNWRNTRVKQVKSSGANFVGTERGHV